MAMSRLPAGMHQNPTDRTGVDNFADESNPGSIVFGRDGGRVALRSREDRLDREHPLQDGSAAAMHFPDSSPNLLVGVTVDLLLNEVEEACLPLQGLQEQQCIAAPRGGSRFFGRRWRGGLNRLWG